MRGHGRGRFGGQRRGRHMLRPTLLLLMHEGPAHGYDMLDRLDAYGLAGIDPSLIYRALREMEAEGLIISQWEEEQTQGPPRRMYSLTRQGDQVLREHMQDLIATRQHIDRLLDAFDQHMDDHHKNQKDIKQKGEK